MSAFVKAARFVGDLDDDFYRDERHRDIWNEASAVGFQVFQWASLAAAAVLPWAAGRTGAWIALGILVVWFIAAITTIAYARARDVDIYTTVSAWQPRAVVAGILYLIGVAGIVLSLQRDEPFDNDPATWAGRVVGAGVALVLAVLAARWNRRREARRRAEEEALDEL